MPVDVGSAVGYLDLDISGFLKNLKSAQEEADKRSKNIATTVGDNLSGAGKKLTSIGTTLTKGVTLPLLGVGVAGLKVATDFDKGMSQVKAISGATGKDFDRLKEKAIELGADTAFSANEVAEAMTEMAKAGWSADQIIDGMGGVLAAAAASGEGLASVSTIVADAITGFGLAAADSSRVADLLTQAANSGTIGIHELGESFKYIAPVAGAMGLSIEDVTTAVSAMSMAGIKGSQAGTALRTMLTRLVKPTDAVAVSMEELGIIIANEDGTMKSLDDIIANLRDSFSGLTDEEKAFHAATLAGQEGMSGMLAILNLTEEEYNAIAESMDNAKGVAEKTATVMQDNLSSKVEQLGGALESLAIKLAEYVIPYLQQFVLWLTGLVDKFTSLSPETQKFILKLGGIALVAGPVIAMLGKLTSGVGGLFTAFGNLSNGFTAVKAGGTAGEGMLSKFGGALAGVTGPTIAFIAVIGLLIAAFVNLWKNNEEFRNKFVEIWNQIKETFERFCQGIVDRLNALGFDFENIVDVIKAIWQGFCDFLAPIFEGAFQLIADIFDFIIDQILNTFDFWVAIFKGDWEGAWNAVKNTFLNIWNLLVDTFKNLLNVLKGIVDTVCKWFGTTWSDTWNGIKTFFINIWNGILNWFKTTIDSIKKTVSDGFESAKNTVTNKFDSIKNKISNVMTDAQNLVRKGIDKIKGFFNFDWSLPKLKLPHFKISGSFSLNPPSVPSFGIEWYKKAMGSGMILDSATLFGFNPKTGKFLGGGEAGSETVVGTKSLLSMIKQTVFEAVGPLVLASRELAKASADLGYVMYGGFTKLKEVKEKSNDGNQHNGNGGDTFIFNSPKPIDEIEAARQMKKTKQDMAEGF